MENDEQILKEIRELKSLIAKLTGVELTPGKSFSTEALDKATKEFQKLSIERGEWVSTDEISKHIKTASWHSAKFIINELRFSNYFKRGQTYYLNKKHLIELGKELKERNVDLSRYEELKKDQANFYKYLETAAKNKEGKAKFKIPKDAKDITSVPPPMPPLEKLRAEVKRLKDEFIQYKLVEYIDVYRDSYAMMKHLYYFNKYIDPDIRKRIKRWIQDFNDVNHLLRESKAKKEKFIPVKGDCKMNCAI